MTPSAREHFWFNLNRYARRLFGMACDVSMAEHSQPSSPVTADHVRAAENERIRALRRSERRELGVDFVLDALQILGAAVCGALATKPDLIGDAGFLPLALALTATIAVFLAREIAATRTRFD
jgi:hypothetical protein